MTDQTVQLVDDVKNLDRSARIALIVSDMHDYITHTHALLSQGFLEEQGFTSIDIFRVPSLAEIPVITNNITQRGIYDLCIIHGCEIITATETGSGHSITYKATIEALTTLSLHCQTPLVLGIKTCATEQEAKEMISNDYAIYGLNYLVQRLSAEHLLETRYQEIVESVGTALEGMESEERTE